MLDQYVLIMNYETKLRNNKYNESGYNGAQWDKYNQQYDPWYPMIMGVI
jgi:hypothetical protein